MIHIVHPYGFYKQWCIWIWEDSFVYGRNCPEALAIRVQLSYNFTMTKLVNHGWLNDGGAAKDGM